MSSLLEVQRRMAEAVMAPLTRQEGMRQRAADGRPMAKEAAAYIKPNPRLESFERLEIYNRQYWFRVLDSLAEDFPGVQAILGAPRFRELSVRYISDCPSTSFTLRNLGGKLSGWLEEHPEFLGAQPDLVRDMVRLEWAVIEAFDAAERAPLSAEQLENAENPHLALQPHVRLLELSHPVDDLLLAVRKRKGARKLPARQLVQTGRQKTYLAVHRVDYSVHYKRLEAGEFHVLQEIHRAAPLSEALEQAFAGSALPETEQAQKVQQWFALWMSLGWFCQV
jgi:hypothetical protein